MVTPKHRVSVNTSAQSLIAASDVALLAQRALDILKESGKNQVYIACVGAPGSGKSTICHKIVQAINAIKGRDNFSLVIPMDGYHFSKSELRRMGEQGVLIGDRDSTIGATTCYEDLMRRRGAPWTFDPKRLNDDLTNAREKGEGCFPLYDRSISDPVPNQISVTKHHQIIICEGNYLISFDDPEWEPLCMHWDDRWFINVSESELKERLVKRHLENWNPSKVKLFGEGRKGAELKVESSDLKNARWVEKTSRVHANLIITST